MDYLDSELIIVEVQKYPCLYDTNDDDFKNREKKKLSWISVASSVMGEEWEDMDEKSKNNIGKEVQKRWKSMKDTYVKSIKTQEGDPTKFKKPYIYHSQMSFLLQPAVQKRENFGNVNVVQTNENAESDDGVRQITTSESAQVRFPDEKALRLPKKRIADSSEPEIINTLKQNVDQPTSRMPDPVEMFLLSQIPLIKKMKPSDKLDFQVKYLKLLQSYVPTF